MACVGETPMHWFERVLLDKLVNNVDRHGCEAASGDVTDKGAFSEREN